MNTHVSYLVASKAGESCINILPGHGNWTVPNNASVLFLVCTPTQDQSLNR